MFDKAKIAIKDFFKKDVKRIADRDSIRLQKAFKKLTVRYKISSDSHVILSSKHDFYDSICYTFTLKYTVEEENPKFERDVMKLPDIYFKLNKYPKNWHEEFKEIYMENFERTFNIDFSWDFDTIVKFTVS